jgi:deazaflavin-dependent oxidoreductase (nitroreductase family)
MVSTHDLDRWMSRDGRPNALARALNRMWAMLASVGLAPKRLYTLEVAGRRTGRVISFPVVVADHEGQQYLVAMLGEKAGWVRNVRAADGCAVLRHRGAESVRLEEVAAADRTPILRRYVSIAPGGRSHIGLDANASNEAFEAVAPQIPVFRVTPRND